MEGFEGLTEEQLQQLIELGTFDDEQQQLSEQMARAAAIRGMVAPEMRGNGRVMVAANPLEFLSQGIQKYQAGKEMKDIDTRRGEIRTKQKTARQALLDALRGRQEMPPMAGEIVNDPGIDTSRFA